MLRDPNHFAAFLRSMHRRFVVVRAMESAGAGVAVAAGPAIILAAALLWLGRDAFTLTCVALAVGAGIGGAWGLMHRPRIQDAAAEVDRQFDLADLMATALSVARLPLSAQLFSSSDNSNIADPWQSAVVAVANERARSLSPSAVVLRRYGARAWGGIGLSAALVLTLGLLSTLPDDRPVRAASEGLPATATPTEVIGASRGLARGEHGGEQESRTAPGSGDTAGESIANVGDAQSVAGSTVRAPAGSMGQSGSGERSASANTPPGEMFNPPSGLRRDNQSGEIAGGRGLSGGMARGEGKGDTYGSAAENAPSTEQISPWRGSSWSADRAAALHDVQSGRVPDSYRDVVRRYFQPEETSPR